MKRLALPTLAALAPLLQALGITELALTQGRRSLPALTTCVDGQLWHGHYCDRTQGRVDTWYEVCRAPKAFSHGATPATSAKTTEVTIEDYENHRTAAQPPLTQAWLDDTLTELSRAATPSSAGTPAIRPLRQGDAINAFSCPKDYICVQGLDPTYAPHILCFKPPATDEDVIAAARSGRMPNSRARQPSWLEPADDTNGGYGEVSVTPAPLDPPRLGIVSVDVHKSFIVEEDIEDVTLSLIIVNVNTMRVLVPKDPITVTATDAGGGNAQELCTSWSKPTGACRATKIRRLIKGSEIHIDGKIEADVKDVEAAKGSKDVVASTGNDENKGFAASLRNVDKAIARHIDKVADVVVKVACWIVFVTSLMRIIEVLNARRNDGGGRGRGAGRGRARRGGRHH